MSSLTITTVSVELHQLLRKDSNPEKKNWKDRQNRDRQEAERKLREFPPLEKMKFSHSIQFNAVPEWSSHYISYSNLKKLYVSTPFSN